MILAMLDWFIVTYQKKKKKRIGFLWLASEVEFNLERQY